MTKSLFTGLLALCLCLLSGCSIGLNGIDLSVDSDQAFTTGETIAINVSTQPFDVKINPNSITCTGGGETWVEDGLIKFQSSEAGTYSISVTQNQITSNTVVLTIEQAEETVPVYDNNQAAEISSITREKPWEKHVVSSEDKSDDPLKDAAKTVQDKKLNVAEVYEDADNLVDNHTQVTINGKLPVSTIEDKSGNKVHALYDTASNEYIILEGFDIPFNDCYAQASGTLSRNADGELVLNMTYLSASSTPN